MNTHPPRIDLRRAAEAQTVLEGADTIAAYPRWLETTESQGAERPVHWLAQPSWECRHSMSTPSLWLRLRVAVCLPLPCQRCLRSVDTPIDIDRNFRFVDDETTAAHEDHDCEEDVLALHVPFDLAELIEEEVLLALPMAPRHEDCALQIRQSVQTTHGQEEEPSERPPNPFAALARWKQ